jgi:glycosyltransferase involved in cell wall biosynthesis
MVWALRRCDAVSGSSRLVAQKLSERAGLKNVGVFHGGVPMSKTPAFRASSAPLILWLGRIVPPKDPQILIRAAARLRDEGFSFKVCIAGKPIPSTVWYMDETRKLIRDLGLDDIVSAPGFVSDADLNDIMSRTEISVQTSHTEGMSIALMEHMMAGIAMVATDVGDTAMAVVDGQTGFLISPKDEGQLVMALRKLLGSPELRLQYSVAGRKTAEMHFSIEAMVSRATSHYMSLLN